MMIDGTDLGLSWLRLLQKEMLISLLWDHHHFFYFVLHYG